MTRWMASDIPYQTGRTAIVTGTGGLGLEDALALSRAGGHVIVAGRNPQKGEAAVSKIRETVPEANAYFEQIDLASLQSISAFSERLKGRVDQVDILINNAGVMTPPTRQETSDGFELQFGSNHLGHFALTAHLMPLLQKGRDARVVTLASVAARSGVIDFDNLNAERDYSPMKAYSQSKLACLMFAREFQRRSETAGWGVSGIASHPGVSRTDLFHNAPGRTSLMGMARSALWFLFQPAAQGALPTLFAATSPNAQPGGYYGPNGVGEISGYPGEARPPKHALDAEIAKELWDASERLTSTRF